MHALLNRVKKALALGLSAALVVPQLAAPAFAASAARLSGLQVRPDEVSLKLDREVKYNAFTTSKPPRLVVELMDTKHFLPSKVHEGQGKFLKRIRTGQHQLSPEPITRIVMDLAESVSYKILEKAGALKVVLGDKDQGETASMAEEAARDAAASDASAAQSAADLPEAQNQDLSTATKLGGGKVKPVARRVAKDIMASLPHDPVNLDFDNTDVRDILKLLAVRAGVNIIYGPDVSGNLSLHLQGVAFNEAFHTVLQMRGLVTEQVGENILRVLTPTVLGKERADALPFTRIFTLNYTQAAVIKAQLDAVRAAEGRKGSTVVSPDINAIVVTDTQEGLDQVARLIGDLDQRPKQVLIEAKLVEVQLSKSLDLGIQWDYQGSYPTTSGSGANDLTTVGTALNPTASPTGGALATTGVGATARGTGVFLPANKIFGALTLGRITSNTFLTATLSAAAAAGKVKVLSDPKVATLNNQQATINITTQIPYVTATVASTGVTTQNVSYITVGITLTVTPTINADGRVTLKVNPTVSQPSAVAAGNATTGAPAVDQRTANTTVLVKDGETIVIGGLISDNIQETVSKVPLLGDIPILGWLFRKTSKQRNRQELLVFVTPKILND